MPDFKEMLKYFRTREHLSQSELAEKLGLSPSTISMYEVGKREPDFETEEKIADFFNTDLNTLRGRDSETHGDYYIDPDTSIIAQRIFEDSDMRTLFDIAKDMEPERLQAHIDFMKSLKKSEEHDVD